MMLEKFRFFGKIVRKCRRKLITRLLIHRKEILANHNEAERKVTNGRCLSVTSIAGNLTYCSR